MKNQIFVILFILSITKTFCVKILDQSESKLLNLRNSISSNKNLTIFNLSNSFNSTNSLSPQNDIVKIINSKLLNKIRTNDFSSKYEKCKYKQSEAILHSNDNSTELLNTIVYLNSTNLSIKQVPKELELFNFKIEDIGIKKADKFENCCVELISKLSNLKLCNYDEYCKRNETNKNSWVSNWVDNFDEFKNECKAKSIKQIIDAKLIIC